jgi:4-methyl-5(b-hydroxyethyl)-thiazole monophosphate biosynthesis
MPGSIRGSKRKHPIRNVNGFERRTIMKKAYIFLANGHEEVEALMVVDLLRRAGLDIATVSITGDKMVTSSHNVTYKADFLFEEVEGNMVDLVVLPGGLPGTTNLLAFEPLMNMVKAHNEAGKLVAAICAAPSVLAELGILDGKKGTSYPGFGTKIENFVDAPVVVDGNVITSRGLGAAIDFGLALIELLVDETKAKEIAAAIQYR